MQPISPVLSDKTQKSEVVYAKGQPEYKPLPVLKSEDGKVISRWTLTAEERAAIAAGADILLTLWTFNQPLQPIYMEVQGERKPEEVSAWLGLFKGVN